MSSRPSSGEPTRKPRYYPTQDIMWSNESTKTLIEEWGDRYVELNRRSLNRGHWQQVSDAVNLRHGDQLRCTYAQARNRIDTVKKMYMKEKARASQSAVKYVSPWPFFDYLDFYIGSPSSSPETITRRGTPSLTLPSTYSIPIGPRNKRPAKAPEMEPELFSGDEDPARRRLEAMLSVTRMAAEEENVARHRNRDSNVELGEMAEAIEKFGERYERVEREKMSKMIELEKNRMQLAIDMNEQMMNYLSELKLKLDRNKQVPEAKNDKESKL